MNDNEKSLNEQLDEQMFDQLNQKIEQQQKQINDLEKALQKAIRVMPTPAAAEPEKKQSLAELFGVK